MCGRCGAVGRLRYLGRFDKDGTPAKRVPWPGSPHPLAITTAATRCLWSYGPSEGTPDRAHRSA